MPLGAALLADHLKVRMQMLDLQAIIRVVSGLPEANLMPCACVA